MTTQINALIAFLAGIGVTYEPGMDWPVFEDDYIKFMSENGDLDEKSCDQFEAWLKEQNATYDRHRERAVRTIDEVTVEKMNDAFDLSGYREY